MRLVFAGWARGTCHTLINAPITSVSVKPKSKRLSYGINIAEEDGNLFIRSKVEFRSSGEFDCQIFLSQAEVILLAVEALKATTVSELVALLSDKLSSSEQPADG